METVGGRQRVLGRGWWGNVATSLPFHTPFVQKGEKAWPFGNSWVDIGTSRGGGGGIPPQVGQKTSKNRV